MGLRASLVALAALTLTGGCATPDDSPASLSAPPMAQPAPAAGIPAQFPNAHTPGEITTGDVKQVCPKTVAQRRITAATLRQVATWYGVRVDLPPNWEWDHRVPHSLLGSDGPANLWPQMPDVAHPGGFLLNRKDSLEAKVHRDVCAGRMTLAAAQRIFLGDWRPLLSP